MMIRRNFYLSEEQNQSLKKMKGLTVSEHIRRAIDEYILRHNKAIATVSPSQKGGKNGR